MTKTAILQNWFAIDELLFGQHAKDAISEDEKLRAYFTDKGALLNNLYEMYHYLGIQPKVRSKFKIKNMKDLVESSKKLAEHARNRALEIMKTDDAVKHLREEIDEVAKIEKLSEEQVARYVLRRRMNAVALDVLMLESVLTPEAKEKLLNDWKGRILYDAHKVLRDALVSNVF